MQHNFDNKMNYSIFSDRFVDSPSKASYPLIVHLIAVMNGTANFSFEKTWGYKNPQTGEFDGMTGQLIRNEADIGGTVLFMVPERLPIMDFISMIIDTRVEFVFRAPPLSYVSNIYYYPFVGAVWIATAVLVVLGSIVIYFTYILPTDEERENSTGAFSDIILLASGLVSQMGTHLNPRILSGHISMVKLNIRIFIFFFLFIYQNCISKVYSIDLSVVCGHIVYGEYCGFVTINDEEHFNA